jgi:beta-L-N-acetylhexosaminidase
VLVCNRPDLVDELRDGFDMPDNAELAARWQYMANTLGADEAEKTIRTEAFRAAREATARLASPKDTEGGVKVGEAF